MRSKLSFEPYVNGKLQSAAILTSRVNIYLVSRIFSKKWLLLSHGGTEHFETVSFLIGRSRSHGDY